ncbi:MAG: hypothetical protein C9356_01040 [Oleiphilus sp.]|nr:MAG: hypothetical protein C9356_01040 [Oleiphilus sp.]
MIDKEVHHMLKTEDSNIRTCLLALAILIFSGCSDTETIGNFSDPPLVFPISYPIMYEGDLYEYDPIRKTSSLVFDTDGKDIVLLDTDRAIRQNDYLGREFLTRNVLPDYLGYSENNRLYLFDLETRKTHELYNFDAVSNINGREQICRLTKTIIPEPNAFEDIKIHFLDELVINVEARPIDGDCDLNENQRFYAIEILESTEPGFRIRQPLDDDPTDIEINSFPHLYGNKLVTDEALMYAGKPYLDPEEEIILHMGFELEDSRLSAYLTNVDSSEQEQIWSLESPDFIRQANERISELEEDALENLNNRGRSFPKRDDGLILQHGNDIIKLDLTDILDDDAGANRQSALDNPAIDLPDTPELAFTDILFADSSEELYFTFEDTLYTSRNGVTDSDTLNLAESAIDSKQLLLSDESTLLLKRYSDGRQATVSIDQSGIETTVTPASSLTAYGRNYAPGVLPTVIVENDAMISWDTLIYPDPGQRNPIADGTENTIAVPLYDGRTYHEHDEETNELFALFHAETQNNSSAIASITAPSLFEFSGNPNDAKGNKMTALELDLLPSDDNYVYVFADEYGLAILSVLIDGTPQTRYFYFDPVNTATEPGLPSAMEMIPLPYE